MNIYMSIYVNIYIHIYILSFCLQSAVGFNEMEAPTTAYKKTTPIEAG